MFRTSGFIAVFLDLDKSNRHVAGLLVIHPVLAACLERRKKKNECNLVDEIRDESVFFELMTKVFAWQHNSLETHWGALSVDASPGRQL